MKQTIIIITVLLALVSCGNKTQSAESTADTTQVDSTMVADGVVLESTDLWTVEAVEAQIRACFDEVNKMAADDAVYINRLDSMFCSKDFLELQAKLYKKVRESKGELMFDGDEGHHWLPDIGTPVRVDSVKSELLTGDQAQAEVWLKDTRGNKGYLEMTLYLEDGAWKIHNWIDSDVYPFGALYNWMQNLLDGGTNNDDEEE